MPYCRLQTTDTRAFQAQEPYLRKYCPRGIPQLQERAPGCILCPMQGVTPSSPPSVPGQHPRLCTVQGTLRLPHLIVVILFSLLLPTPSAPCCVLFLPLPTFLFPPCSLVYSKSPAPGSLSEPLVLCAALGRRETRVPPSPPRRAQSSATEPPECLSPAELQPPYSGLFLHPLALLEAEDLGDGSWGPSLRTVQG